MTKSEAEANLEYRAQVFKALGHPVRLLIMNLVRAKPRHGEELADILRLNPATISHHVSKLVEAELLDAVRDQYYQVYTVRNKLLEITLGDLVQLPQPGPAEVEQQDAYRQKVLRTFLIHGRLKQFPAQLKKRLVIMEELVKEFEPGRRYTELEVNHILVDFHEDVARLRRDMVDAGLFAREHGTYWRPAAEAGAAG